MNIELMNKQKQKKKKEIIMQSFLWFQYEIHFYFNRFIQFVFKRENNFHNSQELRASNNHSSK